VKFISIFTNDWQNVVVGPCDHERAVDWLRANGFVYDEVSGDWNHPTATGGGCGARIIDPEPLTWRITDYK